MSGTKSSKTISSFFLSFILDGIVLNSGYIFYTILKTWNTEGQVSIMPLNTNKALSGIIGAIVGMKICNNDSRSVILWGSLLCATGIGLCSIANDISWLIIFWGAVFGSGYGITSTYLQRELAASGKETVHKLLFKCAPNVGSMFLPFFLELLFYQYGLNGSCLIICGIILNYIPLSLLSFYNIEPRWGKMKWTMRKRSSKYKVNFGNPKSTGMMQTLKQENSFRKRELVSCLEPDVVCHKLSVDNEAFEGDCVRSLSKISTELKSNSLIRPIVSIENNLEIFEKQDKMFSNDVKLSQLILDIEKYENNRKIFEDDFYEKDINVSNDNSNEDGCLEENCTAVSLTSAKNKKNFESETPFRTDVVENDSESNMSSSTSCSNSASTISNSNETPLSSVKQLEQYLPGIFKVNVLEYTFENESAYMQQISNIRGKPLEKNNYRNHANSLITQCYDHIDFTKPTVKQNKTLCGSENNFSRQYENIFNIYEKDECITTNYVPNNSQFLATEQNQRINLFQKLGEKLSTLQLLANMQCLLVLMTTVIYEYILTTLIVLVCIFAKEVHVKEIYFKWILAAFGVGGILGKFCFSYIIKNLKPKISVVSSIFFMLNSLTIIGILWSSTLKWFINFYLILGILQSCIHESFREIREVYVDDKTNSFLSSACKLLLGLIILSLPYLIRFTSSLSGDFELLLEILSCCSVFCAVFCFSLQKIHCSCFRK